MLKYGYKKNYKKNTHRAEGGQTVVFVELVLKYPRDM
jgi:hypothetical protein